MAGSNVLTILAQWCTPYRCEEVIKLEDQDKLKDKKQ